MSEQRPRQVRTVGYLEERLAEERAVRRQLAEALDDAIKAAVNADWSQEDYDMWCAARAASDALDSERTP